MPSRPMLPIMAPAAVARRVTPHFAARASLTTTRCMTTNLPSETNAINDSTRLSKRTRNRRPYSPPLLPLNHNHIATIHTSHNATTIQPRENIPSSMGPIPVLRTVEDVRKWTAHVARHQHSIPNGEASPQPDQGIAFVPTMGALHAGHTDLILAAAEAGHDKLVVSIYLNPAQFGASEDLDSYPQTWAADCETLSELYPRLNSSVLRWKKHHGGSDNNNNTNDNNPELKLAVFAPTTPELYPSGFPGQHPNSKGSFVTITPVGELLEGKTRPTFFRGVATVCMKLFNIVQPARVFFGQKDVQQTVVIRKMVRDFRMPIDVRVVPTRREEPDGLALSSRNVYLGPRRRKVAPVLINALRAAEKAYLEGGALEASQIVPAALKVILETMEAQMNLSPKEGVMFELDYISLADPDSMEELESVDPTRGAILSGAVKMLPVMEAQDGEDLGHSNGPPVRLIDNIILPPKVTPQ